MKTNGNVKQPPRGKFFEVHAAANAFPVGNTEALLETTTSDRSDDPSTSLLLLFYVWLLSELKEMRFELSELRLEVRRIAAHGPINQLEDGGFLAQRSQVAGVLQKSPRTIAKYYKHPKYPLPEPYCVGESGQAHQYLWSEIRVWALEAFGRSLPKTPPWAHF